MLLNCSDRQLRFFQVMPSEFVLLHKFSDRVDTKKWHQAFFITLPEQTRIALDSNSQDKFPYSLQQNTQDLHKSQTFANTSQELFVVSSGDQNVDSLRFFNTTGKYLEIQELKITQEACAHMSVHSFTPDQKPGVHFSCVLASTNGSMLVWMPRPAKFIQPLAPNFVEVDENIVYVEPENEFDEESSGDEMQVDTEGLTKRQIKC